MERIRLVHTFYISMDNIALMAIVQSFQYLNGNVFDLTFGNRLAVGYQIVQGNVHIFVYPIQARNVIPYKIKQSSDVPMNVNISHYLQFSQIRLFYLVIIIIIKQCIVRDDLDWRDIGIDIDR